MSGILEQLMGAYRGGVPMSSATKGGERELFVDMLLRSCLPPTWRIGSGEITNEHGGRSGQLDIVIEATFAPSMPLLGSELRRLYLSESVVGAIEVKSDISAQWDDAVRTLRSAKDVGGHDLRCYAVGFKGWQTTETLTEKLTAEDSLEAILQLEPARLAYRSQRKELMLREGPSALAGFVFLVYENLPHGFVWFSPGDSYLGPPERLP